MIKENIMFPLSLNNKIKLFLKDLFFSKYSKTINNFNNFISNDFQPEKDNFKFLMNDSYMNNLLEKYNEYISNEKDKRFLIGNMRKEEKEIEKLNEKLKELQTLIEDKNTAKYINDLNDFIESNKDFKLIFNKIFEEKIKENLNENTNIKIYIDLIEQIEKYEIESNKFIKLINEILPNDKKDIISELKIEEYQKYNWI
jgi:hypothetical protein